MSTSPRIAALRILALTGLSMLFMLAARGQSDTVSYFTFTGDLEGWTVTDLSAESSNDNWVWSQTGPSGSLPISPIQSSTAAGGYLLFDSDLLCGGSQNARIQSPVLNLSQESVVELRWQQRYRRFESAIYVEVSKDGGQTFAPFELSPALMNDEFTGDQGENPDYVTLDISPVAAGETAVVIAFRFFSEEAIFGSTAGCGYAWMVDDVVIANTFTPAPQYDLAIVSGSHAGAANRVTPSHQVEPLNLGARIINNGVNTASGKLFVRIFDNSGVAPLLVHTDSVIVPAIGQNEESDFLLMPGSFTPPNTQIAYIGRYELVMDVADDLVLANNMARFDFSISESAFAKTNGPDIYARPQASESWGFGNIYPLRGDDNELSRILFWLRPAGDFSTATTDSVFVEVYGITGDGNNDGEYAAGSEATLISRQGYTLSGLTEPTRFFVTPLPDTSLALTSLYDQLAVYVRYEDELAGDSRWVEIGGGRDDANTNYDAEQFAASQKGVDRSFAIRSVGDGPLLASLFPGFIPDVRAYIDKKQTVGTSLPNTFTDKLEVWPNPTSDVINWSFSQKDATNSATTITILNNLGETVRKNFISTSTTNTDVSNLPSGFYHILVEKKDDVSAITGFLKL